MAQPPDTSLVVTLERSGRELTKIKSWSIDSAYLTSTDGFEFTAFSSNPDELADLELQPVRLAVGGADQGFGRIDAITCGDDGTAVTCEGRDYLADLVECNIDPTLQLKEGMSLGEAILLVTAPAGVTRIAADDDTPLRDVRSGKFKAKKKKGQIVSVRELKMEELKPEFGVGCYDFINRLAARYGVTIQPGTDRGVISLSAPDYEQQPLYRLTRRKDGVGNNILSARARRDFSSFPTYSLFTGSQTRAGEETKGLSQTYDTVKAASIFAPSLEKLFQTSCFSGRRKPGVSDFLERGQLYRLLTHRDDESRNPDQIEHAALRAVGERLKDTLTYTVTVQGHVDKKSGAIWSVDTIVAVEDEVTRVFENLWIAQRTLKFSPESGATTDLVCWRPGTFLL